ncbi:Transposase (putative), YhgA-like protein [Candidatus Magnetoovum chiemensis]|nr:Transposase (putative), YhgA-like protein [Candidatus Magnetoovum chiemensis]
MRQEYDITVKSLIKSAPNEFLKMLIGNKSVKFIDTELPTTKVRRPDLLMITEDGEIFHIELQSRNDIDIVIRMLEYFILVWIIYKKFPKQILLYIGDKRLTMKDRVMVESDLINDYSLVFKYKVIDIKDMDCHQLLKSDKIEDVVLSLLCRSANIDDTVTSIVGKLSQLPPKERRDYVSKLLYLADLRKVYDKVKKEVSKMPVTLDIEESGIYKEALLIGEKKGLMEGLIEGKREGLIYGKREGLIEGKREGLIYGKREGLIEGIEGMLEIKYNTADIELMNKVKELETVEQLERFKEMIKKSNQLDDLKKELFYLLGK